MNNYRTPRKTYENCISISSNEVLYFGRYWHANQVTISMKLKSSLISSGSMLKVGIMVAQAKPAGQHFTYSKLTKDYTGRLEVSELFPAWKKL